MQITKLELYKNWFWTVFQLFCNNIHRVYFVQWVRRLPRHLPRAHSTSLPIKRLSKHFHLDQGFPWPLWLLSAIIILPQGDSLYQKFLQNLQRQPQIWHSNALLNSRFSTPTGSIKIILPMRWWWKLWLTSQRERQNSNSDPMLEKRANCLRKLSSCTALPIWLSRTSAKMAPLLAILCVVLPKFRAWKRYQVGTSLVHGNLVQKLKQHLYAEEH